MMKRIQIFLLLIIVVCLLAPTANGELAPAYGIQLYSLQKWMDEDPDACLKQLADWGLKEVETSVFTKQSALELKGLLDKHGLRCTSHHVFPRDLDKNMDAVIAYAKAVGATWVMSPLLPHKPPLTREQIPAIAERFNRWGKKLNQAGLRFAYHTHGQEFRSDAEGVLFDALLDQTDPELVSYEVDVYWVLWGGGNPVDVLKRHGKRICALHLKDMKKGTPTGSALQQKPPREAIVTLGSGMIDFSSILKLAREYDISRLYIEDESPNAIEQIPLSIEFLKKLSSRHPDS
ncbi:MAG: sugar phosphate isomerase/epimerase [Verrucomicrobiales bacterium]|nr:sugar phosphate isomerase/epimerase [Verrucomicrobiales bacterium]